MTVQECLDMCVIQHIDNVIEGTQYIKEHLTEFADNTPSDGCIERLKARAAAIKAKNYVGLYKGKTKFKQHIDSECKAFMYIGFLQNEVCTLSEHQAVVYHLQRDRFRPATANELADILSQEV